MYEILSEQAGIEVQGSTSYTDFPQVMAEADALAKKHSKEIQVLNTETDSIAYVATYVAGRTFNAWERVEVPKFEAKHIDGYVPAYQRVRIGAVVYRPLTKGEPWLVVTSDGKKYEAANTAKARAITNKLREEQLAAKASA